MLYWYWLEIAIGRYRECFVADGSGWSGMACPGKIDSILCGFVLVLPGINGRQ